MARMASVSKVTLLAAVLFCLLLPPVYPGAVLHRTLRQAENVDAENVEADATEETKVVKEETLEEDKQMDATVIDDGPAEVIEEVKEVVENEAIEEAKEPEKEESQNTEDSPSEPGNNEANAEEADEEEDNKSEIPDSMDRCHKCLKPSFKFKKEFYCLKCVKHGIIKENEGSPVQCRKCRKRSYRTKNEEFCKSKCTVETAMELLEEDELEDILEEILEDGDETTTMSPTTTAAPALGLLGNIFKFIVEKTTFGVPATDDSTTI